MAAMQNPGQYLIDTGLLFQINRTCLHMFGLSLRIDKDKIVLDDKRDRPELCVYPVKTIETARKKYDKFLKDEGFQISSARQRALNYTIQSDYNFGKK